MPCTRKLANGRKRNRAVITCRTDVMNVPQPLSQRVLSPFICRTTSRIAQILASPQICIRATLPVRRFRLVRWGIAVRGLVGVETEVVDLEDVVAEVELAAVVEEMEAAEVEEVEAMLVKTSRGLKTEERGINTGVNFLLAIGHMKCSTGFGH